MRLYVYSAVTSGAATIPQQKNNNSADVLRSRANYRLYLNSGKGAIAVICLRRVLGTAAQNLGVGRCRGQK
jgi:hypothetical protein